MQYLTTAQAAERLGVSHARVRALVRLGRIAKHPVNSRLNLLAPRDVERLAEELAANRLKPGRPRKPAA